MCSSRCDRPARSASSKPEPVPIQNPSAADRTESMCSVTTRTPESSSVRRCVLIAIGVAVAAVPRAAGAARAVAAVATVVAVAPRAAVAAVAAVTPRAAAVAAAPGPDGRQLLDGLAGHLRVLGQAQADAAALAVGLDHAHVDLVALVEGLL